MKNGRFIAVVGPSGVGKDSIMAGLVARDPALHLVRRTITRAPGLSGEEYDAVTMPVFQKMAQDGAFCLQWQAHSLHYGIPNNVVHTNRAGRDCLANLSRSVLTEAENVFAQLVVLNITASPDVLAQRLVGRGRESANEIQARLLQATKPLPKGLRIITVPNDSTLHDAVSQAHASLQLAKA